MCLPEDTLPVRLVIRLICVWDVHRAVLHSQISAMGRLSIELNWPFILMAMLLSLQSSHFMAFLAHVLLVRRNEAVYAAVLVDTCLVFARILINPNRCGCVAAGYPAW